MTPPFPLRPVIEALKRYGPDPLAVLLLFLAFLWGLAAHPGFALAGLVVCGGLYAFLRDRALTHEERQAALKYDQLRLKLTATKDRWRRREIPDQPSLPLARNPRRGAGDD